MKVAADKQATPWGEFAAIQFEQKGVREKFLHCHFWSIHQFTSV
jgi:hypothetical protein